MAKDRRGKAPGSTGSPPAGLVVFQNEGPSAPGTGSYAIQVNAWTLEAPAIEYYADTCSAMSVDGAPTLVFAQRGLDLTFINAIAIAMSPVRFRDMVESFNPVLARMSVEELAAGRAIADVEISGVTPSNYRKFFASLIRGGTSNDGAMLDFYRVAMAVQEQFKHGIPSDLVAPCIRVFMNPSTMVHLFDIIRKRGLLS